MTCPFCGGPSHPATGAEYRPGYVACFGCVVGLWDWLRKRIQGKPRRRRDGTRGPSFYDHVCYQKSDEIRKTPVG